MWKNWIMPFIHFVYLVFFFHFQTLSKLAYRDWNNWYENFSLGKVILENNAENHDDDLFLTKIVISRVGGSDK